MKRSISPASTGRTAPLFFVALILTLAALPVGAEPARVDNGAASAEGLTTARLTELWRAGGEDDEIFFGNVGAARVDAQGNVLLLDSQLSVVHIISPEGELVGTICGEGDGPGEVRGPSDMLIAADGTVCVLQGFPGRIVRLHPDGTPAGEARFTTGQTGEGQFAVLNRGLALPQGMLLVGIQMSFGGGSQSKQTYFLSATDDGGTQVTPYLTKEYTIDYADFELSELGMDFVYNRVATASDGTVFFAPDRDQYQIQAYREGAEPSVVFSRPFRNVKRTPAQEAIQRQILEGIGGYYPAPLKRTVIEDHPPVIAGMWATDQGLLWVQTSPGITPGPDGTWAVLDVFDAGGRFLRQVALPGSFDPDQDGLIVLRDGRLIVIVGLLDAFLSQQAISTGDTAEEADPLEIICFKVEL